MKNVYVILTQNKDTYMSSCDLFIFGGVKFHIIDLSQIFDFFFSLFACFNDFLVLFPFESVLLPSNPTLIVSLQIKTRLSLGFECLFSPFAVFPYVIRTRLRSLIRKGLLITFKCLSLTQNSFS